MYFCVDPVYGPILQISNSSIVFKNSGLCLMLDALKIKLFHHIIYPKQYDWKKKKNKSTSINKQLPYISAIKIPKEPYLIYYAIKNGLKWCFSTIALKWRMEVILNESK